MNNTEMLAPRLIGSSALLERPALIVNKIKAFVGLKINEKKMRKSLTVESIQSKMMVDERRASNPKPAKNKIKTNNAITVNHSLNNPSAKVAAQINDFEPVAATWSADFDREEQSCWDAVPVLETELSKVFGTPVKVQIFHANGYAITNNSNEVTYGSMLVTRK